MDAILLSIKPEYVKNIFKGVKLYEYRRRIPKKNIAKIIVYSTYPVMKVIGEVEVINLISGTPNYVWEVTKNNSGISKEKYQRYFEGCEKAYAHKLGKTTLYEEPKPLSDFGITNAPQSFIYI
ncbi:MAG: hypothetical protein QM266_08430 [Bacillota bacterium]|nr:hypothetical protein [Bacillota bacterium]